MPKDFSIASKGFNPFGDLIGLNFSQCEAGFSRCSLEINGDLLNPHGVLHGGVIYSMADTSMGAALYPFLGEGELCATVEIKIVYFRSVTAGGLICDTKLLHRSRTLGFLESEVAAGDQPIAKAMGTFSIFKAR